MATKKGVPDPDKDKNKSKNEENETATDDPIQQLPQLQGLDFSQVDLRRRNQLEPMLTVRWDSFQANTTALAAKILTRAGVASRNSTTQPAILHLVPDEKNPQDILAIPVAKSGKSTVRVTWKESTKATLDLRKLFTIRPLAIPHNHRAYIPVEAFDHTVVGPTMRIRFSQVEMAEIERRRSTKSQPNSSPPATDAASD